MSLEIINNLRKAIGVVAAYPEDRFDLGTFRQNQHNCGTLFCTYGLLTESRQFPTIKWGPVLPGYPSGYPFIGSRSENENFWPHPWTTSQKDRQDELFGKKAYGKLFELRGAGIYDFEIFLEQLNTLSDKNLALARLKKQLALYEAEESAKLPTLEYQSEVG